MLPRVAVFYALGAATYSEVAAAAESVCSLEFWLPESEPLDRVMERYLRTVGPVRRYGPDDVEALAREAERPDAVVTFADVTLEPAALAAAVWDLPFHPYGVAHLLSRKSLQRRALDSSARPVRWTTWPTNISAIPEGALTRPVLVKPDRGTASKRMFRAATEAEARTRLEASGDRDLLWVIEEVIDAVPLAPGLGDYVSIEMVAGADGWYPVILNGRFPARHLVYETGYFGPLPLDPALEAAVVGTAHETLRLMDLHHGLVNVEFKLAPEGPVVVEVNGRLGGASARISPRAGGPDLVREALLVALGRPSPAQVPQWRTIAGRVFVSAPDGVDTVPAWPDLAHLSADPAVDYLLRLRDEGEPVQLDRGGTLEMYAEVGIEADDVEGLLAARRRVLDAFGVDE